MENITRDVISDLWPLYASGEASPDTRALVEAFLREDPEFAQTLHDSVLGTLPQLEAPPLIKRPMAGPQWLLFLALFLAAAAIGAGLWITHHRL